MADRPASPSSKQQRPGLRRVAPRDCVGWREWVGLPELAVPAMRVKVDTGARTSALHAFDLERFKRRGRDMVRFSVHPLERHAKPSILCEAELLEERRVRSSSGHLTTRPVIVTPVVLGGVRWSIELTLAARDQMGFRMLLGREAVRRRFVVDPGRSFLSTDPPPPAKKRRKS